MTAVLTTSFWDPQPVVSFEKRGGNGRIDRLLLRFASAAFLVTLIPMRGDKSQSVRIH
jgi:hypothetical protein